MSNVDSPFFKNYIKKFVGADLQTSKSFERKFTKPLTVELILYIREMFADDKIWIGIDETTDASGRIVSGLVIGSMSDPRKPRFLINYDQIKRANAVCLAIFVLDSLDLVFGEGIVK